jgi:molecular chaperone GrpE
VTSKEPTLADKKKTTRKAPRHSEEPPADADTSEVGDSEEMADIAEDGASDQDAEPVKAKSITVEGGEAEAEEIDEGDDESAPRRPSARDVLNRLLEKNEIILKLNKDNSEKDRQLKDLNEKWLRSVAEFENYRKRSRKEWELLKQQSKTEVILEILDTIDDFERAFSVAEDKDDEFVQGIRLIYNNLRSVLEKLGVEVIESHNRSFDPSFHMAVGQLETEDVESGVVTEVIQKGYRLDDTVIRPARVIVAK